LIDRAGYPFIGGTAALAVAAALTVGSIGAVPLLILTAFFVFFFRDPDRTSPQDPSLVLSPADGRVLVAGPADPKAAPPGEWTQISIFLSPMDVHVNRSPVSGRVTNVDFRPGAFLPAYHTDAAARNERSEVWVDHGGTPIVFRQLVGILARRVVCRVAPGAELRAGERFGIMKFGSRMDVFLPLSANLKVKVGDKVVGGVTVIAVLQ
jgi:phosphatidylserine decarboxylase